MTSHNRIAQQSECANPDHVHVHCALPPFHGDHGPRGSCITSVGTTFTQAPGRHRPVLYCSPECAKWVNRRYMRVDGRLVLKAPTTYMSPTMHPFSSPTGERLVRDTSDYAEASAQVGSLASAAGVPKRSPIRTAMLTELPSVPTGERSLDAPLADSDDTLHDVQAGPALTSGEREQAEAEAFIRSLPEDVALDLTVKGFLSMSAAHQNVVFRLGRTDAAPGWFEAVRSDERNRSWNSVRPALLRATLAQLRRLPIPEWLRTPIE